MLRRLAEVLALTALCGCGSSSVPDPLAALVDPIIDRAVAEDSLTGAVVFSRDGRVLYQRGVGLANAETGTAFTPDTPADGGSLAKPFTAAGIWSLVGEGRVDIDAPVTRYVPEYPHAGVTVRHLISHSNGLPPYYEFFDPFFAGDEVRTTSALLAVVAKERPTPSFSPGTRFEYSNLGFDTAALIIERVTGMTYEAFLRQRFFGPLAMTATFARPARLADWKGVRTLGYRWVNGRREVRDVFDMEAFLGASNLYFSARDLSRWANAHALGTTLPPKVEAAGRTRPVLGGHPSAINGLSWYCDSAGSRCHYGGDINAFHSLVYWDRARHESVVLMTSSSVPPWKGITLQRHLVAALAGQRVVADSAIPFLAFASDSLLRAGTFSAPDVGKLTVAAGRDGLTARFNCGLTNALFQVGPSTFFLPASDDFIAFSRGTPPASLHLRSMFRDAILTRVATAGSESDCP